MKLSFTASASARAFPYNYGELLAKAVYRRLPDMEDHEGLSTHSVGWLWGDADATRRGLVFTGQVGWTVGLQREDAKRLLQSLSEDPEVIEGLTVETVERVRPTSNHFVTESPVLLRRNDQHLAFDQDGADEALTYSARQKIEAFGIDEEIAQTVDATFEPEDSARTRVVQICGNEFRASQCPVRLDVPHLGLAEIIMTTGIGGLTGMGLGSIGPDTNYA